MKRLFLVSLLAVFLAGACLASPKAELRKARNYLSEAMAMEQVEPTSAGRLYRSAFNEAMQLTNPQMKNRYREEALFLASKCLHPSLFVEVGIAIDTYLSLFPNSGRKSDVLVQKALLNYAQGQDQAAELALSEAAQAAKGKTRQGRVQYMSLDGLFYSHKYRTAEKFSQALHDQRKIKRNRRDAERFKKGTQEMQEMVARIKAGDPTYYSSDVRKKLETTYFTKDAPEADLLALAMEDTEGAMLHGYEVSLMGKTRASLHTLPSWIRLEKLKKFLESYPEADEELIGTAMIEIRSTYLHELKDSVTAGEWLNRIDRLPTFHSRAQIEGLLENLMTTKLPSPKAGELFDAISSWSAVLPYDNGWYPVFTKEWLNELWSYSCLLQANRPQLARLSGSLPDLGMVRSIPVRLLILAASAQKLLAYKEFKEISSQMTSRDLKFFNDLLFPLYKVPDPQDMRILTATILSKKFPTVAIDLLLQQITDHPGPDTLDHALALLADLYLEHSAYVEAQSVWSTLRQLFPRSVWVK